jgi:CRP-like cAMP-binding protein
MIEITRLRALPTLRDYDDHDLAVLLGSTTEREFAPDEVIFAQGDRAQSCVLLVWGEADMTRETPEGTRFDGRHGAGALIGQITLIRGGERTATLRARTPVGALEFTREVFESLLRARSPLALRFQRQIAIAGIRRLREATERLLVALADAKDAPAPVPAGQTRDVLRYIQNAADEWGMPMDQVSSVPLGEAPRRPSSRPPPRR